MPLADSVTRESSYFGRFARHALPTLIAMGAWGILPLVAAAQVAPLPDLTFHPTAYIPDDAPAQPAPNESPVDQSGMTFSSTGGSALYQRKCGRCHVLYSPNAYSAEAWPEIVRSMKTQAALSDREVRTLSSYLSEAAGRGGSGHGGGSQVIGPNFGGYLYTEYFQTPQQVKNFDLHYFALSVSGWANDKIHYYAEFELEHGGTGGSNTFIEEAYIDYWFCPQLAIKIGGMLTPFNRFDDFHDPLLNYAITRPQVAREIGVSAFKDVGVDLHGFFDLTCTTSVVFDAYAINGLGAGSNLRGSRHYRDNNSDLALGGRLRFIIHDDYELGISGYEGKWDDNSLYDVRMMGAHFMAHTSIADFYGEAHWAESENPAPYDKGRMTGYFVQASRLFCGKYRPTARYGLLDYFDPGNALGRSASKGDKDISELVLTWGYYPTPNVVFKFEYVFFMEGFHKTQVDDDQIGFQAAIKF